jgi:hypothetical protein
MSRTGVLARPSINDAEPIRPETSRIPRDPSAVADMNLKSNSGYQDLPQNTRCVSGRTSLFTYLAEGPYGILSNGRFSPNQIGRDKPLRLEEDRQQ